MPELGLQIWVLREREWGSGRALQSREASAIPAGLKRLIDQLASESIYALHICGSKFGTSCRTREA